MIEGEKGDTPLRWPETIRVKEERNIFSHIVHRCASRSIVGRTLNHSENIVRSKMSTASSLTAEHKVPGLHHAGTHMAQGWAEVIRIRSSNSSNVSQILGDRGGDFCFLSKVFFSDEETIFSYDVRLKGFQRALTRFSQI